MEPSSVNRFLARLGEVVLIGGLTSVASLGVITIGAAFAAGTAALNEREQHTVQVWLHTFRTTFKRSIAITAGLVTVAIVVVVDIGFFLSNAPAIVRAASVGSGIGLAVCAAALAPHAFAVLAEHAPVRRSLVNAAACAIATPLRTVVSIILTMLLFMAPLFSLALIVPVAGIYCWAAASAHRASSTQLTARARLISH